MFTEIFIKDFGNFLVDEVEPEEGYMILMGLNGLETAILEKDNNHFIINFDSLDRTNESIRKEDIIILNKGKYIHDIIKFLKENNE